MATFSSGPACTKRLACRVIAGTIQSRPDPVLSFACRRYIGEDVAGIKAEAFLGISHLD
jgi:hypothetical protein